MVRTILKIAGGLVILIVVTFGALIGYAMYANERAERAAARFCESVPVDSDIGSVLAGATSEGIRYRAMNNNTSYDFIFLGWVFNAWLCHAEVTNGKITAKYTAVEDD